MAHPGLFLFCLFLLFIFPPSGFLPAASPPPVPTVQQCTDPGGFPALMMPPHVCANVPKENARY